MPPSDEAKETPKSQSTNRITNTVTNKSIPTNPLKSRK